MSKYCEATPIGNATCQGHSQIFTFYGQNVCIAQCLPGFHLASLVSFGTKSEIFCLSDSGSKYWDASDLWIICSMATYIFGMLWLYTRRFENHTQIPRPLEYLRYGSFCYGVVSRFMLVRLNLRCPPKLGIQMDSSEECTICLKNWTSTDLVRTLPCSAAGLQGHCFHTECIDRWLLTSGRCPLCNERYDALIQGLDPRPLLAPELPVLPQTDAMRSEEERAHAQALAEETDRWRDIVTMSESA